MALNPSGVMSIGGPTVGASINLELNLSETANSSIGQENFRTLAAVPSGPISLSDFYGKSNIYIIPPVTTTTCNLVISAFNIPGYVAGQAKVELTIDSGVYLYSCDTTKPALKFIDFYSGDQITIKNNGYILGGGGDGGGTTFISSPYAIGTTYPATAGTAAISVSADVIIENNGYIAGGGGGGAVYPYGSGYVNGSPGGGGGGGGAGGGKGGSCYDGIPHNRIVLGGAGGGIGQPGGNGGYSAFSTDLVAVYNSTGAGGGRIIPGVGGIGAAIRSPYNFAQGGGAGGGGGGTAQYDPGSSSFESYGGAGGSANSPGARSPIDYYYGFPGSGGGGGGGWGASGGGTSLWNNYFVAGAAGGRGVELNGKTATITGSGIIYGAVS
jgi:hypothetical protein